MVYYIIACHKDDHSENQTAQIIKGEVLQDNGRSLGEVYELTNGVDKSQFKVGSLDQLMELMDTFAKYDKMIEASC